MSVRIGSARIDERGKISGGAAGDQTGSEVSTQDWYLHSKGWRVLRAKDAAAAEKIALAMERACANPKIGYDQSQRSSLYNQVKGKGFDPGLATTACETDCSALVRLCACYALGRSIADFNTSSECAALLSTGAFTELTGSKYTGSSDYLQRGDILCTRSKGHTVAVLSDGAKAQSVSGAADGLPCVRVTGDSVNLRDMPGVEYGRVVGRAKCGERLASIGLECGGWYAVKCAGGYAWISGKYAHLTEEKTDE